MFSKHSFFSPEHPEHETLEQRISRVARETVEANIAKEGTTKVATKDLEAWYQALDDMIYGDNGGDVSEAILDLRDTIHSHLPG